MKNIELLGGKLSNKELKTIFGGRYLSYEGTCNVKSCLTQTDCGEVTDCNCHFSEGNRYGYCMKDN